MSNVKWTEEQLQAINEKGNNILVAAAAGSGKLQYWLREL